MCDMDSTAKILDGSPMAHVLVVGMSHHSAPLEILERLALSHTDRDQLLQDLTRSPGVAEVMVVSTCNRVEMYAVVDGLPGAFHHFCAALARYARTTADELVNSSHMYCLRGLSAVEHLFRVTAGMDSMVIGDHQIIGQIRAAYAASVAQQAVGRTLHQLAQHALYTGKRVQAHTDIGRAGASVVSSGLARAVRALQAAHLVGRKAVVIGAGAMGALAVSHLERAGAAQILIANRTYSRAGALAKSTSKTIKTVITWADLPAAVGEADLLITCTGAVGAVWTLTQTQAALAMRAPTRSPLIICDFGLPRDVEPAVAGLPAVTVIDLSVLQQDPDTGMAATNAAATNIITDEVAHFFAKYHRGRHRSENQLPPTTTEQLTAA